MKWLKKLKISKRLLTGFMVVAIITAVVGSVGIVGLYFMNLTVKSVGANSLPSLQNLLTIEQAQTAIKASERTLMSQSSSSSTYATQSATIKTEYAAISSAMAKYEALSKTTTESTLWKKFTTTYNQWKTSEDEFMSQMSSGSSASTGSTTSTTGSTAANSTASSQNTNASQSSSVQSTNTTANQNSGQPQNQTMDQINTTEEYYNSSISLLNQLISIYNTQADSQISFSQRVNLVAVLILVAAILLGIGMAIVLGLYISRSICRPVEKLVEAADSLALGNVNIDISSESNDEIGNLANSFMRMTANIRDQAKVAEKLADGDLTVKVNIQSEHDLLGTKLHEVIENNREVLTNIANASEQIACGSKQISDSSISLSQGATEQASSIEELTATLEMISSQTKHNAENANQANELANVVKTDAKQGNNQMTDMLRAMEEINTSSAQISKVIKVIDDIAFQTNILALNAAVEAARAGQYGKGFAVVADEVRNLAARSANAAKETTEMIESSIKKADDGSKIAESTAASFKQIVEGIDKVATLVNEISIASNEQATGIAQTNQGILQVSSVVQVNAATSEESAAASEELSSQAAVLKEMIRKFKLTSTDDKYQPEN